MTIGVSQPSGQPGAVGAKGAVRREVRKRRRKATEFVLHPSGLAAYRKLVKI